jgi:hypothetical protein
MKLFLGGTCNRSKWREQLIEGLNMDYFNPVVDEWNDASQAEEIKQRALCDFCVYVLTPKMTGFYSIAEAVEDAVQRPEKVVFCVLARDGEDEFSPFQVKSLQAVAELIERHTGKPAFTSLDDLREWLNRQLDKHALAGRALSAG